MASEACCHVMDQLRFSNLNFIVTETPYSANIVIRKNFVKTFSTPRPASSSFSSKQEVQNPENVDENLHKQISALNDALEKSEANLKTSKDTCVVLEEKIANIEAAALKAYEDTKSELNTNKMVMKKYSDEVQTLNKDLHESKKLIKIKERENLKLENKCDNLASNLKKSKEDIALMKAERVKAEKERKKKKVKAIEVSTNTTLPQSQFQNASSQTEDQNSNYLPIPLSPSGSLKSVHMKPSNTSNLDPLPTSNISKFMLSSSTSNSPLIPFGTTLKSTSNTSTVSSKASSKASSTCPQCPHHLQCYTRHPNPPPPFAPITFTDFHYPPKPPPHITILPSKRLSYSDFRQLENLSHTCVECSEGMLYHNYNERVEYNDPGPCGGVCAVYLAACPNSPRACISVGDISDQSSQKETRNKKWNLKCDKCDKSFQKLGHLSFHVNRNHL